MTAREPLSGLERIPVGFPLQDTTLHVLDEDLRQLPPGEIGELCVGGPGVALGYLGLAELTAQRFVSDPVDGARLYRTGDLARQLPSGAIEVLGRRDCQVKLRGFRIELAEIEQSAMATGLCDAAVVEKIGEGPTAYLAGFVLPSSSVEDNDFLTVLSARLADRLPAYMIPARWVVLAELRFGPTGKLDRAQLLELLDEPAPEPAADAQLSGVLGETLRQIWQDVQDVPCAAPGDSFLDLGGNSVTALQVATRIQHRLDLRVEPADVLLADSLADLVRQLRTSAVS